MMMENQQSIDAAVEAILCGCPGCLSVPLSVLALETPVPIQGWGPMLEEMSIEVVTDYIGRPSITAAAARRLLAARKRQHELAVESHQRRIAQLATRHPVVSGGVPVIEGATPFESMVAAGGVVSVQQEFGSGRDRPRFLEEALVEGARYDAEKRKRAANEKARLAAQMKKDLQ